MIRKLTRDVETRSTVDLEEVGAYIYATHPTTEVLCIGYATDNNKPKIWHPGEPIPKEFFTAANGNKWDWVAHNAAFEIAIERYILGPKFGFPIAPIEQQICTMAQAHAMALPGGLEKLAKVLNLKNQKDTTGGRLMMKLSKPRKPRKGEDPNGIYWWDDPELYKALDLYCMKDVATAQEAHQCLEPLSDSERGVWLLDQRVNDYGFYLDRDLAEAARKIAEAMNPRINAELTKITNGKVTAFTQVARILKWAGDHIEIDTLAKGSVEELLKADLPKHVRRVLELRLLGAQAAVAKVDALLQRQCEDGRIRGSFVYHAAGPGRWSSRGAQVHNLKRSMTKDMDRAIKIIGSGDVELALKEYKNPLSVIGDCIRAMIIAKPGHVLIGGDFSGIEARITAWLAKEEAKLQVFHDYDAGIGHDPYIIFAAKVFNVDVDKLAYDCADKDKQGRPKEPDPIAREMRQAGKAGELAFGFQGGVNAYRRFAPGHNTGVQTTTQTHWDRRHGTGRSGGESATLSEGIGDLTDEQIDQIKHTWRKLHPNIASMWHKLNNAITQAVLHPGEEKTVLDRIVIMYWKGSFLWITLPSGRHLAYPDAQWARVSENKDTGAIYKSQYGQESVVFMDNASGRWQLTRMYGGLATENIVQAVARDLLAQAMLRVDAAGYNIVTHVHDECVIEVPEKDAERVKPHFTKLMAQLPDWAEGLPVVVKPWINKRYVK